MSRMLRLRPQALSSALLFVLLLTGCQKQLPPPSSPPPPPTQAERLQSLKQRVAAGRCAQALPDLNAFVDQVPDSAEAFLLLGLCNAKQNDPERAGTALSRAASLEPDNPRPLEALGILRYGQKKYPAARDALTRAAALGSSNAQTYYYLGNLDMQAGHCPQALDNYRKAMAKDPAYHDAFSEYRAAAAACAKPGMGGGNRGSGKP
ncbi:MAG: tetratricopeptide repeat protein [Acidobacteriota bacterium]